MICNLYLDSKVKRPVIYTKQFEGCEALLDTGAEFPVWTGTESMLREVGGVLVKNRVYFGGFGGIVEAKLYTLNVQVGTIYFPNMHILFHEDETIPGYLLLSATMFSNMRYTVDDAEHKISIDTLSNQVAYNLRLEDKNGKMHVLCTSCDEVETTSKLEKEGAEYLKHFRKMQRYMCENKNR